METNEPAHRPPGRNRPVAIPLISWQDVYRWGHPLHPLQPDEWLGRVPFPAGRLGPHAFALRVSMDDMEPAFTAMDILILDPDVPPVHRSFVVAVNQAQQATFKQVIHDDGRCFLAPLNPRYPVHLCDETIKIIATLRFKYKEYT